MKKIFYIVVFLMLIFFIDFNVFASSKIDLCLVYEKDSYEKGDLMKVSLELPKFSNLFEVIIRLEYDEESINPVSLDNEYFKLNNHSIFNEFIINKKLNNNTLYAELMKNDVNEGYYSSYKNNLCTLEFNVLSHINDTFSFINNINVSIFLFDINHSIIEYDLKIIEQIDAGFLFDSYDVDVYSDEIDLKDVFYVKNRDTNEYEILEEKTVNYLVVGSYIMQIGVFDYLTGKYLSFSTIINVVDNISPIVTASDEYIINDNELKNINFNNFIDVSDNYDEKLNILVKFYDKNMNILKDNVIEQFKRDFIIYVGYAAVDSSFNESEEVFVRFILNDLTAPKIEVDDVYIKDSELEEFDILDSIKIKDELDSNPSVILSFYNNKEELIDDYKKYLTVNECCYMDVYGKDLFNNISTKYRVKIFLVDTTAPVIKYQENAFIEDVKLDKFDFYELIDVFDNDIRKCNISYDFYINDNIVSKNVAKEELLKQNSVMVKYYVYDYSLNYSTCIVKVKIKDTMPPVISVNIADGMIYKELTKIIVEVKDNLSENVILSIYLDNQIYNGEEVLEGEHELCVEAIDESGNKIVDKYNFKVNKNNILCANIKIKSSVIVVFIGISSVAIGLLKFRINRNLKTKYKES